MNQRGQYGRSFGPSKRCGDRGAYGPRRLGSRAAIGAQPFRSEDADAAFRQISSEMESIVDATYRAMGVDPAAIRNPAVADDAWSARVRAATAKAKQSPLWSYWESSVSPKYDDWHAQGKAAIASWEDYERWLGRVTALRAEAQSKGIKLETPDPVSLEQPSAGGFPRWAMIGAVAVGGVVAVAALASSLGRATR